MVWIAAIVIFAGSCAAIILTGRQSSVPAMDKDGTYYHIEESTAGTYETEGSQRSNGRPCDWTITSTPTIHISDMRDMGRVAVGEHARVTVHTGEYFVSYGCLPWRKVG